jgi:hypothetical protein
MLGETGWKLQTLQKRLQCRPELQQEELKKMLQNHMIDFRIIRDMSSMNSTGYIQFLLMVVNKSAYTEIIERMYREMQEYL